MNSHKADGVFLSTVSVSQILGPLYTANTMMFLAQLTGYRGYKKFKFVKFGHLQLVKQDKLIPDYQQQQNNRCQNLK